MRSRTKTLLALGVACLSTAVVASGAMAHGGHREKLGKISKKGGTALKVEVRGVITGPILAATATTPGSITFSAAGTTVPPPTGFVWTCAIPAGSDVSAFTEGNRVKAKCRSAEGTGLTLTKLRHKDHGDKVKVEASGIVDAFTAAAVGTPGTITINTGVIGQLPVTCAVTDRTRVRGNPTPVTGMAKIECKSKNGVLTAKKIKVKVPKVEAKGMLTINGTTSVTVGTVTCAIPAGTTVDPALAGKFVEIKCLGTPPVLAKIELEEDDDHHHHHHHH